MWYVIQTITGKEEELVHAICELISRQLYKECFIVEKLSEKRLGGSWIVQEEKLFPSYIFIISDLPEQLFHELKRIPEYSKIIGNYIGEFIPLEKEEELLFRKICERRTKYRKFKENSCDVYKLPEKYIVPLSKIEVRDDGEIIIFSGPLRTLRDKIIFLNLRKRYAIVRIEMGHRNYIAQLGIILKRDEE